MAAETKWTPGPWVAKQLHRSRAMVVTADPSDSELDVCNILGYQSSIEIAANARLIAAAPDLYEALQRLEQFGHTDATWDYALRAMAKARGEA